MNTLTKPRLPQLMRFSSTVPEFVNRNPRNLEQMRIARKPDGYHLDKPGRKFWHKYELLLLTIPWKIFFIPCLSLVCFYHIEGSWATCIKRHFWRHRLFVTASTRAVTAQVIHYLNGPIIEAKTTEWCLRKQLYSTTDYCAYVALGRVLAQRCLESGITEMYSNITPTKGSKLEKLLNEVVDGGIKLEEMEVYKKPNPWDLHRPEKPWEVHEE